MKSFNSRSENILSSVNPDLKALVDQALQLCEIQFQVYYGLRTIQQQIELVKAGKSKTYNSRHLHGCAVDVYAEINPGKANWNVKYYRTINDAFDKASKELEIKYVWGGEFVSFKDYNHFELNKLSYPDKSSIIFDLKSRKLIK